MPFIHTCINLIICNILSIFSADCCSPIVYVNVIDLDGYSASSPCLFNFSKTSLDVLVIIQTRNETYIGSSAPNIDDDDDQYTTIAVVVVVIVLVIIGILATTVVLIKKKTKRFVYV